MSADDSSVHRDPALSFASVAEAYDRARPAYPADAVRWLAGPDPVRVLELGAGTGKLTELLLAAGHTVIATDPLPQMLALLRRRAPGAHALRATAERIPVPTRSVDVVVCAQSFHWFDAETALPEIARVLRPGGAIALAWNRRDEGIPWVRKLGRLIGAEPEQDLHQPLVASAHFGEVDQQDFRFWQWLRRDELSDLVRSRSSVAVMEEAERAPLLDRVGALYDDYGRGPDGMRLPYLTRCFRSLVDATQPIPEPERPARVDAEPAAEDSAPGGEVPGQRPGNEDTATVLIDFR